MAPVLYVVPYSQPVRATLMTIKAINIDVELREVNLINKEQFSDDFTKINPQHTVPTLIDGDFIFWESHAIMPYLVDKYCQNNDSLYPKDLQQRATITQRLHFNNSFFFPISVLGPVIYKGEKTIPQEKIDRVLEGYHFLEQFLKGSKWVAGDFLTIADFALIPTITTLDVVIPVVSEQYPNISAWIKRAEELECYEENKRGLDIIRKMVEEKLV